MVSPKGPVTLAQVARVAGVTHRQAWRWMDRGYLHPVAGTPARPGSGYAVLCELGEVTAACALADLADLPNIMAEASLFPAVAHAARHARPEFGRWLMVNHLDDGPAICQADDGAAAWPPAYPRTLIELRWP